MLLTISLARIIIAVIFFIIVVGGFIWTSISMSSRSKTDWDTLNELEDKATLVKTKEEIKNLYDELSQKGSKINNRFILPRLMRLEGYLRGLYKNVNQNKQ